MDAGERDAMALDHLDPGAEHLRVRDRRVEHAVVAPSLGLAPLCHRVAVRRRAEDLRELAVEDRVAVARADVRHRVEAEVLLGEVGEEVREHVVHARDVAVEFRRARAGGGELAPRDDAPAAGREAHQARVGQVEEVLGGHRGART